MRIYTRLSSPLTSASRVPPPRLSTALSSLTVRSSVALLSLTYGLGGGVGVGLAYVAPMSAAMKVREGRGIGEEG